MRDGPRLESVEADSVPKVEEEDLTRFLVRLIFLFGPTFSMMQRARTGDFVPWILPCVILAAVQSVFYTAIYPWLKQRPFPMPRLRFFLVNWAAFTLAVFLAIGISRGGDAAWGAAFGKPAPGLESKPYDAR